MTNKPQKPAPVPPELALPKGTKVFGFDLEEIPNLSGEDLALATISAKREPTRREMLYLIRYDFAPRKPNRPKLSIEELIKRYQELKERACKL